MICTGAGPLGPFVQVPIPGGGPAPLEMGAPMGGPRGVARAQGRAPRNQHGGRGGFGGPMPARGFSGRGYFDLDAPENQRGVLDYGDL